MYQRFFSQAARACSGKSWGEKTRCMKAYRIKALQAQIKQIQRGVGSCTKSKDPAKCKATIQQRVEKLKGQITSAMQ